MIRYMVYVFIEPLTEKTQYSKRQRLFDEQKSADREISECITILTSFADYYLQKLV